MPFGELALEFVLGIGAALALANLWVLVRPLVDHPRNGRPVPRPPSVAKVVFNLILGTLVATWALVTLLVRR